MSDRAPRRPPTARARLAGVVAGLALVGLASASACSSTGTGPPPGPVPGGTDPGAATVGGTSAADPAGGAVEAPPTTIAAAPGAAGAPGALLTATPIPSAPHVRAWQLAYHSRDAADRDIAVTGLLMVPNRPPPPGGFPLLTWAHPTTGTADLCAPSRKGTPSLPFPDEIAAQGWAIVATDYEGLGTSAPHPYLVGASEGHAVLDAARAASQVDGAGVEPTSPVVIWGFSQGGHAAAFAGELAPTYAPELPIRGDVVVAPVSDVAHFAARAEKRPDQLGVIVTIAGTYRHAYPELDPATVFTPTVLGELDELERQCIGEINTFFDRPIDEVLVAPATGQAPYAARFAENLTGQGRVPVPVLVLQGAADDIVDPADTRALVERWCTAGVTVASVVRDGVGHGVLSTDPLVAWTTDRFTGAPAPTTCSPGGGSTILP